MTRSHVPWQCRGAALILALVANLAHADSLADAQAAFQARDYGKAASLFGRLAAQGDPVAQFYLGHQFDRGLGLAQDHAQALDWYRKAANQGLADAQFALGVMFRKGLGTAADDSQAVAWYRQAARQGHPGALNNLAFMLEAGLGIERDLPQAVAFYRLAAASGLSSAQVHLARLHEQGLGVAQDTVLAAELLATALAHPGTLAEGDAAYARQRLAVLSQARVGPAEQTRAPEVQVPSALEPAPQAMLPPPQVAQDAQGDACPLPGAGEALKYRVQNPRRPADYVHAESNGQVTLCIVDAKGVVTQQAVKPGGAITVRGRPPFLVSASDAFKETSLFFQGRPVKLDGGLPERLLLVPNAPPKPN